MRSNFAARIFFKKALRSQEKSYFYASSSDTIMVDIASEIQDPYELEDESKAEKSEEKTNGELKILGTDLSYTHKIMWFAVYVYVILHVAAAIGLLLCFSGKVKMASMLWALFYSYVGSEGTHMGAHRCFSHRSFKPNAFLKTILLIMQATSGQGSAYMWAREHRQHHRYSDTDGDPHNSKRGLFYSHMGWLMTSRHPLCKKLRKTIDITDLNQDKLIMFQYRYYRTLYFFLGFLLPVWVPMHFFKETFVNSLFVCYFLRYVYSLHVTWFVNSLAHKFGMRPYDKTIQPVESWFVSFLTLGEGWHNYHHAYPWDYKAAEIGMSNATASIIKFCASIGLADELKSVDTITMNKRIKNKGDGTYKSEHLDDQVTAIGPLHRLNPSFTTKFLDPDVKLRVRIKA